MSYSPQIAAIALKGIQTIPDCEHDIDETDPLVSALSDMNGSSAYQGNARKAERLLTGVTTADLDQDQVNTFLNGWRSTHITALYVSGLMIRIQREATQARFQGEAMKAELLSEAAYHIGEIIAEDTGVVGANHNNLFDRFAKSVSGNDQWKLDQYEVPECIEFRKYVERQRTKAPIEDAILTTAASENWNTGEYTFFAEIVEPWLQSRGQDPQSAKNGAAYVSVHAGDTELNHFTHALKAWQLYCAAHGREADPKMAQEKFGEYAQRVGDAFGAMTNKLGLESAHDLSAHFSSVLVPAERAYL